MGTASWFVDRKMIRVGGNINWSQYVHGCGGLKLSGCLLAVTLVVLYGIKEQ